MSEELKSKLKEARAKLGETQKQFAARLGVPVRTLESWEANRASPGTLARRSLDNELAAIMKQ